MEIQFQVTSIKNVI